MLLIKLKLYLRYYLTKRIAVTEGDRCILMADHMSRKTSLPNPTKYRVERVFTNDYGAVFVDVYRPDEKPYQLIRMDNGEEEYLLFY